MQLEKPLHTTSSNISFYFKITTHWKNK